MTDYPKAGASIWAVGFTGLARACDLSASSTQGRETEKSDYRATEKLSEAFTFWGKKKARKFDLWAFVNGIARNVLVCIAVTLLSQLT